jgi:TATA-box binding protein (TBP) (component of TFIID and TFIIIB)
MCSYSPKKFTGLKLRLNEEGYNQTAIIFGSGYVNLTGSKTIDLGYKFFTLLIPIIAPFCDFKIPMKPNLFVSDDEFKNQK